VWGILFSKITPFVFGPKNPGLGSCDLVTEIHALPWSKTTSKKAWRLFKPSTFHHHDFYYNLCIVGISIPIECESVPKQKITLEMHGSKHGVSSSHDFMQALINYYLFRE
jgi:hypothetical protein